MISVQWTGLVQACCVVNNGKDVSIVSNIIIWGFCDHIDMKLWFVQHYPIGWLNEDCDWLGALLQDDCWEATCTRHYAANYVTTDMIQCKRGELDVNVGVVEQTRLSPYSIRVASIVLVWNCNCLDCSYGCMSCGTDVSAGSSGTCTLSSSLMDLIRIVVNYATIRYVWLLISPPLMAADCSTSIARWCEGDLNMLFPRGFGWSLSDPGTVFGFSGVHLESQLVWKRMQLYPLNVPILCCLLRRAAINCHEIKGPVTCFIGTLIPFSFSSVRSSWNGL